MNGAEREAFVESLWEQYLKGGVSLSEYATYLARNAEWSFHAAADLSAMLTACAAIETSLRKEALSPRSSITFRCLIAAADIEDDLRIDLERLRSFRNSWVHVHDPDDDAHLLDFPEKNYEEIEEHARLAMKCMVRTFCSNQLV